MCSADFCPDVFVDSATWNHIHTKVNTRFDKQSERPLIPSEFTYIKVNGRRSVRAKQETYTPQRNILSKLQWDNLQILRKGSGEGSLRLRRTKGQASSTSEKANPRLGNYESGPNDRLNTEKEEKVRKP